MFCGRVFIFLFQSFPLGDKSSVNLRGEYHTENVTTFDDLSKRSAGNEDAMDVDNQDDTPKKDQDGAATENSQADPPAVEEPSKRPDPKEALDMDSLYPMFWNLQAYFSAPTRLFDANDFNSFKSGLESTIVSFRKVSSSLDMRGMGKGSEEMRRAMKRKRGENESEITTSFNPKYLTSRDLFELEVSICSLLSSLSYANITQINDVAFRRHILVQSLILLDFLLSLTPNAKAKLSDSTNKSVLYSYVLSDDDVSICWPRSFQISSNGTITDKMGCSDEILHSWLFAKGYGREILLSNGRYGPYKRQELGSMESRRLSTNSKNVRLGRKSASGTIQYG